MQQTTCSTTLFLLRLLCCCFRFAERQVEDRAPEYQEIETDLPAQRATQQSMRARHSSTQTSGPLNSGTSRRPPESGYDADSESSTEEDGYLVINYEPDHESGKESSSKN